MRISETYVIHVDERRVYDNDDYNIYEKSSREYFKDIVLGPTTVIANGRPVGELIESTSYAGGMCNMSWNNATIISYVKPDFRNPPFFLGLLFYSPSFN